MVLSNIPDIEHFTGNGSQTAFSPSFVILAAGDVEVWDVGVLKTLTTHYTVSGVGGLTGFTVTFIMAPANGNLVSIRRKSAPEQLTDYIPNSAFPAATHETALDKLAMLAQRTLTEISRCLKLPVWENAPATLLPKAADRANRLVGFDAAGVLSTFAQGAVTTTLDGLADVNAPSPAGNDVLQWNAPTSRWINAAAVAQRLILVETKTLSAVALADFVTGINATSSRYVFTLDGITVSTDGAEVQLRVSTDGGSTFKVGASDYKWGRGWASSGPTTGNDGSNGDTKIPLGNIGSAAGEVGAFDIDMSAPANTGVFTAFIVRESAHGATNLVSGHRAAMYAAVTAVDAIRFLVSAGTFSGTISLFKVIG